MTNPAAAAVPQTMAAALVLAQANAQAVGKDKKNEYHRYKYASAEAIIEEARGALTSAGLALLVTTWRVVDRNPQAKEKEPIGRLEVDYLLVHGMTGVERQFTASTPIIPEKGRPEDKAEAGALTSNLGYFLRGLLLLPREDETAAVDQRDDRSYQGPASDERPPAAQPAAADPDAAAWDALEKQWVASIDKAIAAKDLGALEAVPPAVKKSGAPVAYQKRVSDYYNPRSKKLKAELAAASAGTPSDGGKAA